MSDYNGPSYHAKVRILEPCGYMDLRPGMEVEAVVYPELDHVQVERLSQGKAARWWSIRKDAVQEVQRHGSGAALVSGIGPSKVIVDDVAAAKEAAKDGAVVYIKNGPFKGRTYRRNALGQLERVHVKRQ